jgi:hypothetical protein
LNQMCWIDPVDKNLAFGFAAVSTKHPRIKCGQCFLFEFLDPRLRGKRMVVQINNHGGDVVHEQFDLSIPGGGEGLFTCCSSHMFPSNFRYQNGNHPIWGKLYGGLMYGARTNCDKLPLSLRQGCRFWWDFLLAVDNPMVRFRQVVCPPELVARSGTRNDAP